MQKSLRIALVTTMWLLSHSIHAAAPSADDFLPPVQAATPEQQQQLSKVQGPVQEVQDPKTGATVAEGATAQDAINFIVDKHTAGAKMARFGSGIGWVATGIGGYTAMPNPTATRIAKRNAYVKAFLEAKKKLAEAFNGLSSEGRNQIAEQMLQITDDQADLTNSASTQEEQIQQSVQKLLKGFVIYSVEDDTATSNVYVNIVTTPKTLGKFNRPSTNGLEAGSIRDGLGQVLLEIQNGLIPPVGGKMILVKATGEMAFVGFGSDVVRTSDNRALQAKMRLNATKIAQMRAKDALVGMIIGDDTSWKKKLDESTREIVANFEASDGDQGAGIKRLEKTRNEFLNTQVTAEQFQSLRRGVLPPGVNTKTFTSKDGVEVYAVSVYIPSVSRQASAAAREMSEAQLLEYPNSNNATRAATPEIKADSPPAEVAPGPTGTVSRDQDL